MIQDKMHLVNKIFNNETIRTVWNTNDEKYYISVVDIVSVISNNPQTYWRVLKKRLKDEGNETVTNCNGLKLKSKDGKYRMIDVVDIERMFRTIESIPSKNAESIKQWLSKLGSERVDEVFDPSIATQRSIDFYRSKGFDENIEVARRGGKITGNVRKDLENEIGESVVTCNNVLNYEYNEEKEIEMK